MVTTDSLQPTPEKSTKERIFTAAVALFAQRGFSGVSIREIGREVGIKESSFYNHFSSKDELLESIFSHFAQALGRARPIDEIDAMLDAMPPDAFLLRQFATVGEQITPLIDQIWRIIYMEQFRDPRARELYVREMFTKPVDFHHAAFTKMMERGLIKKGDPLLLAEEYNYPFTVLSLEYNFAKSGDRHPQEVIHKMVTHIHFFWNQNKTENQVAFNVREGDARLV